MTRHQLAGIVVASAVMVGCNASNSSADSPFCQDTRALKPDYGLPPERVVNAENISALTDTLAKLADEAPQEIAADARVVSDTWASLRPQFGRLQSSTLGWSEFTTEYVTPMAKTQSFVTANANVDAFVKKNCGV